MPFLPDRGACRSVYSLPQADCSRKRSGIPAGSWRFVRALGTPGLTASCRAVESRVSASLQDVSADSGRFCRMRLRGGGLLLLRRPQGHTTSVLRGSLLIGFTPNRGAHGELLRPAASAGAAALTLIDRDLALFLCPYRLIDETLPLAFR